MNIARTTRNVGRLSFAAILIAAASGLLLPAHVSAHPLGNFTINRYNGLTMGVNQAQVDRVVDMAEIPALQARQEIDTDTDGVVSNAEGAAWADSSCRSGADDLALTVDGNKAPLDVIGLGLTFPTGQAGLVTLRLVCTYSATYPAVADSADVAFIDHSYAGRLGWREIVATGDAVSLSGAEDYASGSSNRLHAYPPAATEATRAQSSADFHIAVDGGAAAAQTLPVDAVAVNSSPDLIMAGAQGPISRTGVADLPVEISAIFQAQDLTWPAIILSVGVAMFIGALHAASPGHGKTLMAAYLVGTRGTVRHALGLGLTVTISHTIGVLGLGAVVLLAGAVLPSERLFPLLGLVGGIVVTALGAAMLAQRLKMRRVAVATGHDHADELDHDAAHDHTATHDHPHAHPHEAAHDHGHVHAALERQPESEGWHSHGIVRHTHLPQDHGPLSKRNLVALGLVGGLVPSASAILILVGSIAAGRPAYGILLTIAFGIGMAVVLVGVGVLLVRARSLVERLPSANRLAPVFARLPLVTAVVFLIVGSTMAVQAGTQLR